MAYSPIIFQGSAQAQGDTYKMVRYLTDQKPIRHIDLLQYQIAQFDYSHANRSDDFLSLIRQAIAEHDLFVFATPVYWYTMSGTLKKFLDRFSDLLKIEKELGRQLRGKSMAVMSIASDDHIKPGFLMPFQETANYLGMNWVGHVHAWQQEGQLAIAATQDLDSFLTLITS